MRQINLTRPARPTPGTADRLARLTRHLKARLEDFGPGGPQVLRADQDSGTVAARLPGQDPAMAVRQLARDYGVQAAYQGGEIVFRLSPDTRFEDLDYLWGCLFELLGL